MKGYLKNHHKLKNPYSVMNLDRYGQRKARYMKNREAMQMRKKLNPRLVFEDPDLFFDSDMEQDSIK